MVFRAIYIVDLTTLKRHPRAGGDFTKMVFMQLTIAYDPDGYSSSLRFGGVVTGMDEGGVPFSTPFFAATIPAPGALALLGFAGLIGRPRRRRV